MTMKFKISVVICTYNRANLLRDAIISILNQEFPQNKYELLIVDNNSTDNTREVVEQLISKVNNVRYVFEEKQGLSHARNRGWKEARGEYVGFLDDDAKASAEWLSIASDICHMKKPAAFGGPYYPFYLTAKPYWFKDEYKSFTQGESARCIKDDEYLVGGNIFIRREVLEIIGGFNPGFGMRGNTIAYAEEIDLIHKIRNLPEVDCLYYEPKLYIEHVVRPEKMKWGWVIRFQYANGRDLQNLFPGKEKQTSFFLLIFDFFKSILLLFVDMSIRVFFRDRKRYAYIQNYYYEHTTHYVSSLGRISAQFKEIFYGKKS